MYGHNEGRYWVPKPAVAAREADKQHAETQEEGAQRTKKAMAKSTAAHEVFQQFKTFCMDKQRRREAAWDLMEARKIGFFVAKKAAGKRIFCEHFNRPLMTEKGEVSHSNTAFRF